MQGAKEGLVGAYDAAAGAAASAADTIKHTAEQVTGGTSSGSSSQQAGEMRGGGFGHGSGSSSSPSGGGYAGGEGSSLGQAWEDLKHGGSKAPRAVANAVRAGRAWASQGCPAFCCLAKLGGAHLSPAGLLQMCHRVSTANALQTSRPPLLLLPRSQQKLLHAVHTMHTCPAWPAGRDRRPPRRDQQCGALQAPGRPAAGQDLRR